MRRYGACAGPHDKASARRKHETAPLRAGGMGWIGGRARRRDELMNRSEPLTSFPIGGPGTSPFGSGAVFFYVGGGRPGTFAGGVSLSRAHVL